jgi:hypothetical protein
VLIFITYMVTSSSSAYGSSFHDNGDGIDNKKSFFTPGKRKSTHDDDDDDGSDNGTSKDDQGASMTPKDRCKGWCGHMPSWHHELVGPERRSCSRCSKPITPNTQAVCNGSKGSTAPDAQAQSKGRTRAYAARSAQHADAWEPPPLFECVDGTEKLACNFYYSTVSPDHQAGTGVPPRNPGLRPNFQVQHLLSQLRLAFEMAFER